MKVLAHKQRPPSAQDSAIARISGQFLGRYIQKPYRNIGKHRHIRMEDVVAYKAAIDQERETIVTLWIKQCGIVV